MHHTAVAEALNKSVQTLFLSIPNDLEHLCAAASPAMEALQAPQETLSLMWRAHVDDGVPKATHTSRIHGNEDKIEIHACRESLRLQPAHHIISAHAAGQIDQP
jgi:hypothetical protein